MTGILVNKINIIKPDWRGLRDIFAGTTTRLNGFSGDSFSELNLARHVGDSDLAVRKNRRKLKKDLNLPENPAWLNQKHGTDIIIEPDKNDYLEGDASISFKSGKVCTVMTADCLPILVTNKSQNVVAAIHAGWRGLAKGVIEKTLLSMKCNPEDIIVWLGPAISQEAFEVGDEVREIFLDSDESAKNCFKMNECNRWQADIYGLAKIRLKNIGVSLIYGGEYCTFYDDDLFFSYRRENICGRMVSMIYIK
jgi:hypothetical protein